MWPTDTWAYIHAHAMGHTVRIRDVVGVRNVYAAYIRSRYVHATDNYAPRIEYTQQWQIRLDTQCAP